MRCVRTGFYKLRTTGRTMTGGIFPGHMVSEGDRTSRPDSCPIELGRVR